jgi:hypothetical protein
MPLDGPLVLTLAHAHDKFADMGFDVGAAFYGDTTMALHLHCAERTDLLADGLGALLADPLPDPFAEELVPVTRAKRKARVVGSEAQVRAAIGRRAVRASGLRHRLQCYVTQPWRSTERPR